jgi:hypothetical protein
MPAARSRCVSTFVAIARQDLPLLLRYEASQILALLGFALLIVGFFTEALSRYGGTMISVGWVMLGLAFLASLTQSKFLYGQSRSRLIRQLDDVRRNVGLDQAILPESLEFLEASAQQWERIEHSLQSQTWREQDRLRSRIFLAAHGAMENILILECGSSAESGMTDEQADRALTESVTSLRLLADQVDATSSAITTYPREEFDSNGIEPDGVIPEFEQLEEALVRLGQTKLDGI